MRNNESAEMYLETIYLLTRQRSRVRSVDVAEHMGYSKPSVSRAVSILKESGYITFHEDKSITLTETGRKVATNLFERQVVLSHLLMKMGVDEDTAYEDGCRLEHVISDESFEHIKKYLNITDEDIVLSADPKTGLIRDV